MTSSGLRERFAVQTHNAATISRLSRDAIAEDVAEPYDPEQGREHAKYVPYRA